MGNSEKSLQETEIDVWQLDTMRPYIARGRAYEPKYKYWTLCSRTEVENMASNIESQ